MLRNSRRPDLAPFDDSDMTIPSDNYIVSRDANEAERLELQHRLEIVCQGYYLHPDIKLPANARVAEHCTSTAIWLREFAAAHPETECHSFDLSSAMFPQPEKIPANVQMHLADVKKPAEERWQGYFDVVHLRLIAAAMRTEDWAVVLKGLVGMLKPGGWVQWVEDDRPVAVRRSFRPVAPLGEAERSLQGSGKWQPPRLEILSKFNRQVMPDDRALPWNYGFMNLDTLMADASVGDLENVNADGYVVDREDDGGKVRRAWAEMGISAVRSMLKATGGAGAEEEWSEGALKEIDMGAHWISRVTVFTGRKRV